MYASAHNYTAEHIILTHYTTSWHTHSYYINYTTGGRAEMVSDWKVVWVSFIAVIFFLVFDLISL